MIYLHNYASADDVIGTSAVTPYVGIAGNGKPIFASKAKYGDTVKFVADDAISYFKPYWEEETVDDNESYIIFTIEELEEGDSIYIGNWVNTETEEWGDAIYITSNGENKIIIPEGYHIEID